MIFLFVLSFLLAALISWALISALPGRFHLDETQIQGSLENPDWTKSWESPEISLIDLISESIGYTLGLQSLSFFIVLIFSFVLSLLAVNSVRGLPFFEALFAAGISAPALFWIPLLIYVLSLKLDWFPLRFESSIQGWILPVLALSLRPLCLGSQILLSELKKAESQTYFIVARSKGLSRSQVYLRHGLKNALIPFATQAGNFLVQSLMGSVLVENLFSVPGVGLLFVKSLQSRDLPVVLALTLLFTLLIMIVHILVEWLHSYLEPRQKRAEF